MKLKAHKRSVSHNSFVDLKDRKNSTRLLLSSLGFSDRRTLDLPNIDEKPQNSKDESNRRQNTALKQLTSSFTTFPSQSKTVLNTYGRNTTRENYLLQEMKSKGIAVPTVLSLIHIYSQDICMPEVMDKNYDASILHGVEVFWKQIEDRFWSVANVVANLSQEKCDRQEFDRILKSETSNVKIEELDDSRIVFNMVSQALSLTLRSLKSAFSKIGAKATSFSVYSKRFKKTISNRSTSLDSLIKRLYDFSRDNTVLYNNGLAEAEASLMHLGATPSALRNFRGLTEGIKKLHLTIDDCNKDIESLKVKDAWSVKELADISGELQKLRHKMAKINVEEAIKGQKYMFDLKIYYRADVEKENLILEEKLIKLEKTLGAIYIKQNIPSIGENSNTNQGNEIVKTKMTSVGAQTIVFSQQSDINTDCFRNKFGKLMGIFSSFTQKPIAIDQYHEPTETQQKAINHADALKYLLMDHTAIVQAELTSHSSFSLPPLNSCHLFLQFLRNTWSTVAEVEDSAMAFLTRLEQTKSISGLSRWLLASLLGEPTLIVPDKNSHIFRYVLSVDGIAMLNRVQLMNRPGMTEPGTLRSVINVVFNHECAVNLADIELEIMTMQIHNKSLICKPEDISILIATEVVHRKVSYLERFCSSLRIALEDTSKADDKYVKELVENFVNSPFDSEGLKSKISLKRARTISSWLVTEILETLKRNQSLNEFTTQFCKHIPILMSLTIKIPSNINANQQTSDGNTRLLAHYRAVINNYK